MGMGFVGALAGGPVQQSPVQSPVQSVVQQTSVVQQVPLKVPAPAPSTVAPLGGPTVKPIYVTPVMQVPTQVIQVPTQVTQVPVTVQQVPTPSPGPTAAAGGAVDGVSALTATLRSTIDALAALVKQLMDRIKQSQDVVQQTTTTPTTPPSSIRSSRWRTTCARIASICLSARASWSW